MNIYGKQNIKVPKKQHKRNDKPVNFLTMTELKRNNLVQEVKKVLIEAGLVTLLLAAIGVLLVVAGLGA